MNNLLSERLLNGEIECNLCGQSRLTIVEKDQQPYRVLKCRCCSLMFVYPHPEPEALKKHYDMAYYRQWLDEQKHQRLRMWKRRLRKIRNLRQSGRLLDIGCGEGTFLALAQKDGWKIAGTEVSGFASKQAAAVLNTDIFCGDLLAAGFEENSFDVVTMWHVLEHVVNPMRYLLEIQRIVKPEGLFVLAVPNVDNIIFQTVYRIIKGRKMRLFTSGEKEIHLYHFSSKTIKNYLDQTGFKCLKISPDFGVIDFSKKIINLFSTLPFYLFKIAVFDAFEIIAAPVKRI